MQVVSKWHTIEAKRHTATGRVDRITLVSKARSNRDEAQQASPLTAITRGIDAHSLFAAQVVATRLSDAFDLNFEASNHMVGTKAYDAALERKIIRMDQGSFYHEAV